MNFMTDEEILKYVFERNLYDLKCCLNYIQDNNNIITGDDFENLKSLLLENREIVRNAEMKGINLYEIN